MKMKRIILYCFWFCAMAWNLSSCQDELVSGYGDIPKGTTTIQLTTEFKPLQPALTRADGKALHTIDNLYVLLYDAEGKLIHSGVGNGAYEVINFLGDAHDTTASGGEADACKKFNLTIPFGIYKMYAVANVDNFNTSVAYQDVLDTEEGLKNISLTWNADASKNKQMFGYFTEDADGKEGFDAPTIVLNKANMSFHAWLKRLASKVTVAFDGSSLKDNVFIYLQSVQIKDIPAQCFLGSVNKSETTEQLIEDGEKIMYSSSKDFRKWPMVAKGACTAEDGTILAHPYDPTHAEGKCHLTTSSALYFFENMQGVHPDKDKRQDMDGSKVPDDKENGDIKKDGIEYGSYIEVKAYYVSSNVENLSSGPITYRFMLGKDIKTDYDAERNHHYKLTLKYNGYANDVDWHIEYVEQEGTMELPPIYYISYLYNEEMGGGLPVKINGVMKEGSKLTARIILNSWEPFGAGSELVHWTGDVSSFKKDKSGNIVKVQNDSVLWGGFLSLRDTEMEMLRIGEDADNYNKINVSTGSCATTGYEAWVDYNNNYKNRLDCRVYGDEFKKSSTGSSTTYVIPMYTRPKQLVPASGFTGNNPFVGYPRKASVELSVTMHDGTVLKDTVDIYQVRRLINPTGIWRRASNDDAFVVTLMAQDGDNSDFEPVISMGTWSAEIEKGSDWIKLNGKLGGKAEGTANSEITFTYQPNGTIKDTDAPRCGVILVKYHNLTCTHRILVRQGYQPMTMSDVSTTKWLSFNMYSGAYTTSSPLEEGTLFRYNNWKNGIWETNNWRTGFGVRENPGTATFNTTNGAVLSWSNITSYSWSYYAFYPPTGNGGNASYMTGVRVPEIDEYRHLQSSEYFEHAYGVLYGDEATETKSKVSEVYEFRRNPDTDKYINYGMRGCFVYNKEDGRNLFFPVGAKGNGRRLGASGTLRYGTTGEPLGAEYRPLLYDLYLHPGAIYWPWDYDGWDINFRQLDFNTFGRVCWGGTTSVSDAAFVRCVLDE